MLIFEESHILGFSGCLHLGQFELFLSFKELVVWMSGLIAGHHDTMCLKHCMAPQCEIARSPCVGNINIGLAMKGAEHSVT